MMAHDPDKMYLWRKMSDSQRQAVLAQRVIDHQPIHSLPHYESDETTFYMVTATCFEHKHVIGQTPSRMADFEKRLLEKIQPNVRSLFAWVVLPNHYHILVDTLSIKNLLYQLGRLHGRTSFDWNGEDHLRGRQVWCNAAETAMKSEGHFYASFNYVLNNAVHHGYVKKWTEWPYCNAANYLERVGRERAIEMWKSYPLFDYGMSWDPPDL